MVLLISALVGALSRSKNKSQNVPRKIEESNLPPRGPSFVEEDQEFQKRYLVFAASNDFKLLEQFTDKYRGSFSKDLVEWVRRLIHQEKRGDRDAGTSRHFAGRSLELLDMLIELLKKKGWEFSRREALTMVKNAIRNKDIQYQKSRLLMGRIQTKSDLYNRFFELGGSRDEELLTALTLAVNEFPVKEDQLKVNHTFAEVKQRVTEMEREREIALFESGLAFQETSEGGEQESILARIDSMTGVEFEGFLASLFSKMGYAVEMTKGSGDQGADLVISKYGEIIAVQAKRAIGQVGNRAVQETVGAIAHYRADKGMVVTNSGFTSAAVKLAASNGIDLVDRVKLNNFIVRYW